METFFQLDHEICNWFDANRSTLGKAIMRDVTALGGQPVLTMVVLFTLGLLLAHGRPRTAGFVLAAVVGGSALAEALKLLVGRPRPAVTDPEILVLLPTSSSFPSGHSMLSALIYLTLALLVAGRLQGRRVRVYLIAASIVLTMLIGFSRMYLGVHYFTDVLGGWTFGLAWALLCTWVAKRMTHRLDGPLKIDEGNGIR